MMSQFDKVAILHWCDFKQIFHYIKKKTIAKIQD